MTKGDQNLEETWDLPQGYPIQTSKQIQTLRHQYAQGGGGGDVVSKL